jgi:hypothetical protein
MTLVQLAGYITRMDWEMMAYYAAALAILAIEIAWLVAEVLL